jgi:methylmalonyl-CoA/ethylmalonyl-CoA epimerase
MKRRIQAITVILALLTVTGALVGTVPPATAQGDAGFEISFHHVGVSVPNVEESIEWYRKMLGFDVVQRMSQGGDNGMVVAHIKRGNCYIELFQVAGAKPLPEYRRDPSADLRVHGLAHIAFQVSDVFAAVKELKAKGAEIAMEPVDTPGVAFAFIRDNSGNCFELIQYKKQ